MESSKNLSTIFNSVFPFSDFLYILQQEEYSSRRYLKWLKRFFFRRNIQKRGRLKYTFRAKITLCAAIVLWIISLLLILPLFRTTILPGLFSTVFLILAIPIFVLLGNLVVVPASFPMKRRVIGRAAEKVRQCKGLKVIAIAGSFGKTTTKNFVYDLIRYNYKTQMVPENINTPLGIADWINLHLRTGTEILIVEMDAYQQGDIATSCTVTPPDIAIITSIGDQHLERFSSKANLAKALNEVFSHAKSSAHLFCNADTASHLPAGSAGAPTIVSRADLALLDPHPSIIARFSSSNIENLAYAVGTAKLLNVSDAFIIDTCAKLELPDRRQKLTTCNGYDCVDDSYNISFTTARAGILSAKNAAAAKGKKLLVVTAGIPELGPEDKDKNEKLGKELSLDASHIALLGSMFSREIARGIADPGKYTLFDDLQEFFKRSKELFPPEKWLLLLQPELTDLYY